VNTLRRAARAEEAGSRCLWVCWLLLFGVAETYALRTRRMAPLTNTLRWASGARQSGWHARLRRWAFAGFLAWLAHHVLISRR
jgi:hypothetical protein